jgi:hypothetical protein
MATSSLPASEVAKAKQKLLGLNSQYQNLIGTIDVAKANAENITLPKKKRDESRIKFEQDKKKLDELNKEISSIKKQISDFEKGDEVSDLRTEVRSLREKYNAKLDKRDPSAIALRNELESKEARLKSITGAKETLDPNIVPESVEMFLSERGTTSALKPRKVKDTGGTAGSGGTAGTGSASGTGSATEDTEPKKNKKQLYNEAVALAQSKYNMPDIIFNNVPSLNDILKKFVEGKIDTNGFVVRVQNDPWYRQNSEVVRNRYLQLFNYEDLKKQGQAVGTSSFEQELKRISDSVQDQALKLFGSRIPDTEAVEQIAKDLYIYNLENSTNEVRQRISKFLRPTTSIIGEDLTEGFGGEAKENYDALYETARANGFTLDDILPRDAQGNRLETTEVLKRIATGKLDVNRIQDDIRRLAAQGRPDYVKDLLAQGNDLDMIYAPYRKKMASVLELTDPLSIDIDDPALQMGISKEGDMNLFDYEKALRKDSRWKYTENARDEASTALDTILKDFGFRR